MFTGLVEELGEVDAVEACGDGAVRVSIRAVTVVADAAVGSSIAVNGCCLTAVEVGGGHWVAHAVPETLRRTNLGVLRAGSVVNLERPLTFGGRVGGHLVQGHVDATATVVAVTVLPDGSDRFVFSLPRDLSRYVVEKGSIAVDGISLTVAAVAADRFEVAVIPHTKAVTTLGIRSPGDRVNLEVDLVAKYLERLVGPHTDRVVVRGDG